MNSMEDCEFYCYKESCLYEQFIDCLKIYCSKTLELVKRQDEWE